MSIPDPHKVFVVHGRNAAARDAMFAFLRAIGLHPIEWEQAIERTGVGSPYIGDVLDKAFTDAQAIVVLLTPDEITYLRPEYAEGTDDAETEPAAQARPNVLFEAGMAMGHDAKRTVLVELGKVRPFTDVIGRHAVKMDNSAAKRKALAQRLKTAGCEVNLSGDDWLSAGDLTPPASPGGGLPLGRRVPTSPNTSAVSFDVSYHDRGRGNGRLQVVNRGTETAYQVDIVIPPEAQSFHVMTDELPLAKLPSGKSFSLVAGRVMGPGKSHFDVRVVATLADGTPVEQDVFLSLVG